MASAPLAHPIYHDNVAAMNTEDQSVVMTRIGAAITRIEAASKRALAMRVTAQIDANAHANSSALTALQARHEHLRSETAAALQALDAVISRAQTKGQV